MQAGGHRFDPGTLHARTRCKQRFSFADLRTRLQAILQADGRPRVLTKGGNEVLRVVGVGCGRGSSAIAEFNLEAGNDIHLILRHLSKDTACSLPPATPQRHRRQTKRLRGCRTPLLAKQ